MASISAPTHRRPSLARELPALPRLVGIGLWLRVLLRRGALDRALARGTDPVASRELAARAGQLTGPRGRHLVANALERALRVADRPRVRFASSAVPPDVGAIRANRSALEDVVARVRSPERIAPAGLARLLVLLRDGGGPLYLAGNPEILGDELDRADRALSR